MPLKRTTTFKDPSGRLLECVKIEDLEDPNFARIASRFGSQQLPSPVRELVPDSFAGSFVRNPQLSGRVAADPPKRKPGPLAELPKYAGSWKCCNCNSIQELATSTSCGFCRRSICGKCSMVVDSSSTSAATSAATSASQRSWTVTDEQGTANTRTSIYRDEVLGNTGSNRYELDIRTRYP